MLLASICGILWLCIIVIPVYESTWEEITLDGPTCCLLIFHVGSLIGWSDCLVVRLGREGGSDVVSAAVGVVLLVYEMMVILACSHATIMDRG